MKKIWILTLYPEYFTPLLNCGVIGQVLSGKRIIDESIEFKVELINIRDYSIGKYRSVDDHAYGDQSGMVLRADILEDALISGILKPANYSLENLIIFFPSPRGKVWNNQVARQFSNSYLSENCKQDLVFIAGRYEGVDERFLEKYVNHYYSIGDFVLSGGELAIMSMLDSALRFCPGALGDIGAADMDSFEDGLLEGPVYTKPQEALGVCVPSDLLEGNHAKLKQLNLENKIQMTKKYRPDLWLKYKEKNNV